MLTVNGKIVFIKQVEEKKNADYTTPAHQKIQVQVMDPEKGFTIIEVKDKEFKYKKDQLDKEVSLKVSLFSANDIYFTAV